MSSGGKNFYWKYFNLFTPDAANFAQNIASAWSRVATLCKEALGYGIIEGGKATATAPPSINIKIATFYGDDRDGNHLITDEETTVDVTKNGELVRSKYITLYAKYEESSSVAVANPVTGELQDTQFKEGISIIPYQGTEVAAAPYPGDGSIKIANIKPSTEDNVVGSDILQDFEHGYHVDIFRRLADSIFRHGIQDMYGTLRHYFNDGMGFSSITRTGEQVFDISAEPLDPSEPSGTWVIRKVVKHSLGKTDVNVFLNLIISEAGVAYPVQTMGIAGLTILCLINKDIDGEYTGNFTIIIMGSKAAVQNFNDNRFTWRAVATARNEGVAL